MCFHYICTFKKVSDSLRRLSRLTMVLKQVQESSRGVSYLQEYLSQTLLSFCGYSVSEIYKSLGPNMIVMRACLFFQGTSRLPEGLERLQRLEHWSRTGWRQDFTGSILSQRGPNRLHGSSGVVPDGNNTLRNCRKN